MMDHGVNSLNFMAWTGMACEVCIKFKGWILSLAVDASALQRLFLSESQKSTFKRRFTAIRMINSFGFFKVEPLMEDGLFSGS